MIHNGLAAFLFLVMSFTLLSQTPGGVILAEAKDGFGYINQEGEWIIEPIYRNGGLFNDGLAPVRQEGTYGYIDRTGKKVLASSYDYAEPFQYGIARVWEKGKLWFINTSGETVMRPPFGSVGLFGKHGYAQLMTSSGHYGLISKSGELLVDTLLEKPLVFDASGHALAQSVEHAPYDDVPVFMQGIVDTNGVFTLNYGTFEEISSLGNGWFKATLLMDELPDIESDNYYAIIDSRGGIQTTYSHREISVRGEFRQGNQQFIPVDIYDVDPDTISVWSGSKRYTHAGLMTPTGEIVFEDIDLDYISNLEADRVWAKDTADQWRLISPSGELLIDEKFSSVIGALQWGDQQGDILQNGGTIVELEGETKFLNEDLSLHPVPELPTDENEWRLGPLFILTVYDDESDEYEPTYGWYYPKTKEVVKPRFSKGVARVAGTELIQTYLGEKLVYVSYSGEIIYRGRSSQKGKKANIDYLHRGGFYASSPQEIGIGGHATSDNAHEAISSGHLTDYSLVMKRKKGGLAIELSNAGKDTLFFPAQDTRIEMVLQAKDVDGEWRDIEYLPSSWCGNSYHTLTLPPGRMWSFTSQDYAGSIQTMLRPKVIYTKDGNAKERFTLYGNTLKASINPAQFWRKPGYQPGGLMDPYLD